MSLIETERNDEAGLAAEDEAILRAAAPEPPDAGLAELEAILRGDTPTAVRPEDEG